MQVELKKADKINERLEIARELRNMTKRAFAKSIGISPQGYQAMVNGNYCQPAIALAIEYAHGFSREWITEGKKPMRVDIWERVKGEVEEEIINELRTFFRNRLKRITPVTSGKENYGTYEKKEGEEAWGNDWTGVQRSEKDTDFRFSSRG